MSTSRALLQKTYIAEGGAEVELDGSSPVKGVAKECPSEQSEGGERAGTGDWREGESRSRSESVGEGELLVLSTIPLAATVNESIRAFVNPPMLQPKSPSPPSLPWPLQGGG